MGPHIPINAGSQPHRAKFQRFIGGKSVIQKSKFQIREFHAHMPCRPGPEAWLSRAGSQCLALKPGCLAQEASALDFGRDG